LVPAQAGYGYVKTDLITSQTCLLQEIIIQKIPEIFGGDEESMDPVGPQLGESAAPAGDNFGQLLRLTRQHIIPAASA
jgi:hypothetical protein